MKTDGNVAPCYPITENDSDICESTIAIVKTIARSLFTCATGSHDWDHTLRVSRLCRRIGEAEGADLTVVLSAAFLHDIGRGYQDAVKGAICHAAKGAQLATPIVSKLAIHKNRKDNILHCIESHRFRGAVTPETIEAKVLFDADKLDAIGAVGVARAFMFAGEVGACLHNPNIDVTTAPSYSRNDTGYREFKVKLCKIRERILTKTGRQIAEERHRFMDHFFKRFIQEFNGER
ncbi:MAG: HD domain-containing protein [Desulfobacterales bacterium]|jgi:uncharacterized protein|nr:HD domain-containing protein [Desulfobacterales bacterium]